MFGPWVGNALLTRIPKDQAIAALTPCLDVQFGEGGLTAFIIFIQVNERRQVPLVGGAGDRVDVRQIFLPWRITEDLERLALGDAGAGRDRDPLVDRMDKQILLRRVEAHPAR